MAFGWCNQFKRKHKESKGIVDISGPKSQKWKWQGLVNLKWNPNNTKAYQNSCWVVYLYNEKNVSQQCQMPSIVDFKSRPKIPINVN